MEGHWKKQFNYDYLGAYSIDNGSLELTIKSLDRKEVKDNKGGSKECLVCYFEEVKKPMILNKTNCDLISSIAGSPEIQDWKGVTISLVKEKVKAFGTITEALRVSKQAPKKKSKSEQETSRLIKSIQGAKTFAELDKLKPYVERYPGAEDEYKKRESFLNESELV